MSPERTVNAVCVGLSSTDYESVEPKTTHPPTMLRAQLSAVQINFAAVADSVPWPLRPSQPVLDSGPRAAGTNQPACQDKLASTAATSVLKRDPNPLYVYKAIVQNVIPTLTKREDVATKGIFLNDEILKAGLADLML